MPFSAVAKRASVACAVTIALVQAAQAAASCAAAAGHVVTLVKRNWPSNGDAPGDMVGTLMNKPSAGFVSGKTRFLLKAYSDQAFIKEVKRLRPPLTPAPELLKAFVGNEEAVTVSSLPGSDLFAANTVAGTLHCNSTVFFSANRGQASLVPSPESWENDVGSSCGQTRSFASANGLPVVIDDDLSAGPSLTSSLVLTPWSAGKWQKPCRASFVFAPRFDPAKTFNDWAGLNKWEPNTCGKGGCGGFQRAALDLVRQTQEDRAGAEAKLLAALTGPQGDEYRRLKRIADHPDPEDAPADDKAAKPETAAALTDTRPLLLPMVVDGRVFLASLGHFTIGWRVFADWKVTVEAGEADKVREIAHFAIGMTQGPIVSATVE
ncbi:hypothetical protein PY365_16055 [Roseiarcaceae bacterium H3SJ34-1]|uniref:hypothetical protein n=1 Tax=Terripilifer ovatus TaxID=3032367 RepID=UPI003AB9A4A9|nr:hypothetical protein [Roseiarcaceae bacterium H3SJ34-1]